MKHTAMARMIVVIAFLAGTAGCGGAAHAPDGGSGGKVGSAGSGGAAQSGGRMGTGTGGAANGSGGAAAGTGGAVVGTGGATSGTGGDAASGGRAGSGGGTASGGAPGSGGGAAGAAGGGAGTTGGAGGTRTGGAAGTSAGGTAGAATGGGGGAGKGGAGGGTSCSGPGICGSTEFCDFGNNSCGTGVFPQGTCKPRPGGCTANVAPTCACDHQVYSNACGANAAGQDAADNGGCTAPAGKFPCGSGFCNKQTEYCRATTGGALGVTVPGQYQCTAFPAACTATPTCTCLQAANCTTSADGDVRVSILAP